MQIFCCLRKFRWITLPQLFQKITRSSSSIPQSVSRKGNNQPTENSQKYNDTYPERNENFFLPHGHPNCLPILNTCSQGKKKKKKRERYLELQSTCYLNTYNSRHPQKAATTAAPTHPGARGTRPTSEQHSNTLHRSPGAVAKGRRCQHMFIPLR